MDWWLISRILWASAYFLGIVAGILAIPTVIILAVIYGLNYLRYWSLEVNGKLGSDKCPLNCDHWNGTST